MLGKSIERTETAVEEKRGDEVDQDTRPSSSSTDLDPKRFKPATMSVEKLAGQMTRTLHSEHLRPHIRWILMPREMDWWLHHTSLHAPCVDM